MNLEISMLNNPKITFGETVPKYSRQLFSLIKGKTKTVEAAKDIMEELC